MLVIFKQMSMKRCLIRRFATIPRHDRSPNLNYTMVSVPDKLVSSGIYTFTNGLRLMSCLTVKCIKLGTDFTVGNIIKAKEFNQQILPAKMFSAPIAPIVHKSVIKMKNMAVLMNRIFDGSIKIVVLVGKEVGKFVGITIVIGFKLIRYVAINKYTLRDFAPATQDSIEYFFKCTVSEGFEIIEAIDYSLTSLFGASTDYVLQTVEHCFGENVKDISKELSTMSQEMFDFYKKVKLFKIRSLKTKVVKSGIKETVNTILNEIRKPDDEIKKDDSAKKD